MPNESVESEGMNVHDVVREFWNARNADEFDSRAGRSGRMEAISLVAALAKPHLSREGTVSIELGCGSGLFAEAAGARNIVGVDFSSSLLAYARRRMDTVWQKDIFELQLTKNSVDNIVSLFVIDDYPSKKKRLFFARVFSFLKQGGHFFFAAYSPNDERMGSLREVINPKAGVTFQIHLEDASFYKRMLRLCGFKIDVSKVLRTRGFHEVGKESMTLKREFIIIVARKPANEQT
jgi:ubiquinone/menaquinone biosynthesis C-methylase UbiE